MPSVYLLSLLTIPSFLILHFNLSIKCSFSLTFLITSPQLAFLHLLLSYLIIFFIMIFFFHFPLSIISSLNFVSDYAVSPFSCILF